MVLDFDDQEMQIVFEHPDISVDIEINEDLEER